MFTRSSLLALTLSAGLTLSACTGAVTGRSVNRTAAAAAKTGEDASLAAARRADETARRLDGYIAVLDVLVAYKEEGAPSESSRKHKQDVESMVEIIRPALLARQAALNELAAAYEAFRLLAEGASNQDFAPEATSLAAVLAKYGATVGDAGKEGPLKTAFNAAYAAYSSDKVLAANAVLQKAAMETASVLRKEMAYMAGLEGEFILSRREAAIALWDAGAFTSAPLLDAVAGGSGFAPATDSPAVSGKACAGKGKARCPLRDVTLAFSERKAREQTETEKRQLEDAVAALEGLQAIHDDVAKRREIKLSRLRAATKLFGGADEPPAPVPAAAPVPAVSPVPVAPAVAKPSAK